MREIAKFHEFHQNIDLERKVRFGAIGTPKGMELTWFYKHLRIPGARWRKIEKNVGRRNRTLEFLR